MGYRCRPLDGDQCLWRGPDDVEAVEPEEVHVRTRVRQAKHAVDVERVRAGVNLEPLADDDLERLTRLDLLDRRTDGLLVLLRRALAPDRKRGTVEAGRHHACRCGLDQQLGHGLDPSRSVGVRLIDALVGVVEVDGVRHQPYFAVVVIQHGEVGGQQKSELGDVQVVDTGIREPFHPAYRVVAEITNQPGGEGWQPLAVRRVQQAQRLAYGDQGVSTARQPDRCMP